MSYEFLSLFVQPVLVLDSEGLVTFANEACEEVFGLKVEQIRGQTFPDFLKLKERHEIALEAINLRTRYIVSAFDSGVKRGDLAYALGPFVKGQSLVSFYDRTVETRLPARDQGTNTERARLEEILLNQRADLLITTTQLERKITQTEFLLKFYARTRFTLEIETIARQFLQLGCNELGFRHGFFFTAQTDGRARLSSYYVPDLSLADSSRLQAEAEKLISLPTVVVAEDPLTIFDAQTLADPGFLAFYQNLGLGKIANGIVLNFKRENQTIGQFHLLNYVHNQAIGRSALDMLRYMVDPILVTFENAELYRASVTDELTQINNVRYFRIRLEAELARAKKNPTSLALLMFDIDNFKSINDRYGHPMGDQVIRAMANALKMGVRGGDVVARYGGEEMAAILPDVSFETANVVAERLRASVAEIEIASDQGPIRFTTSVGVSFFPQDASEMEGLISCADQALYRAKRAGRNRVVIYVKDQELP